MKRRKMLSLLTACAMLCGMAAAMPAVTERASLVASAEGEATSGTYEGMSYTNYGDYIVITGCDDSVTEVVIPNEIDGVPVTRIAEGAFSSCTSLTNVVLPEGLTSVGSGAFYGCTALESVTIPESLTSIGEHAFYDTAWLAGLQEAGGPVIAEHILFDGGDAEGDLVIPDGITAIAGSAFSGCGGLTSIKLPEGLISIGNYAFSGCSALTSIVLPEGLTSIGYSAFSECTALESVTIPESVTSIGEDVFYDTPWMAGLQEAGNPVIAEHILFDGGDVEGDLVIPDGITAIAGGAFSSCEGLTSVVFPEGVTTIGERAFSYCSGITYMSLPSTLKTVGEGAFEDCYGIYDLYYNGTREMWNEVDIDDGGESMEYTSDDYSSWDMVNADCNGFLRNGPIRFIGSDAPAGPVPEVTEYLAPDATYQVNYMDYSFGRTPKLQYVVGEELDLSGGTLCVSGSADTSTSTDTEVDLGGGGSGGGFGWGYDASLPLSDERFTIDTSAFDSSTPGNYPIYISYTEAGYTKTIYITASVYEAEDFPYIAENALGDLNGDTNVNAVDASLLLIAAANASSGIGSGLTPAQEAAADVNGDGNFDAKDASLILLYAAYRSTGGTLELEEYVAQH